MSEKKKYSFKCAKQNCPDRVCCTRPHVNVTYGDLSRWTTQNYLNHILQGIALNLEEADKGGITLGTLRKPLSKDPEQTACIFFDEEANACRIRFSRPISCRTFPLEHDGEKFYVTNKNCAGIGKGEVTREALKEAKELAEKEYNERIETNTSLPAVYSVIMGQMLRKSAEAMQSMSEEDRQKLEEIMSKRDEQEESSDDTDASD
ncbi:YkgJ family cysteine cluster protein [Candidatus Thorarchaeota archaeon]|nr:MAG: YkgJ family cysteine cluster protein [Candidatus Thorarchaeota archaeon]